MSNPYYHPEDFGLTIVGMIEVEPDYDFDMLVVWTDGTTLYWAEDSGCSCPSPFEDFTTIGRLNQGGTEACVRAIDAWVDAEGFLTARSPLRKPASDLKAKVREMAVTR